MSQRPGGTTRRQLLRRSGLVALAAGGLAAGGGGGAHAAVTRGRSVDYTARDTFDVADLAFHAGEGHGRPDHHNEAGGLAWIQAYYLAGYARMYDAHRDTYYLDRLVTNIDQVLTMRDSARGVTDYRGLSLPAWRTKNPYTVGVAALADAAGRPVLELRTARAYADTATVTVAPGSRSGTFQLTVHSGQYGYTQTFDDLTMDAASPDFAVRRLYDGYHTLLMVTARDLRETPSQGGDPAAGQFPFASAPAIYAVHTGMITYPMASFVRTVLTSPPLAGHPHYGAKAREYLGAVEDAVAVHDAEWRDGDRGDGYLQWPKGMPVPYDGTEQPLNQFHALGLTMAELAAVTGNRRYRDRVAKMARGFAAELAVDADDAYVWHYWPTDSHVYNGYGKTGSPETDVSVYSPQYGGAKQIEDISHAAISVEFAWRAFRDRLGFTGGDMARLSRTFTRNVAGVDASGVPTAAGRIDGSGGAAAMGTAVQIGRWMPLAWWDRGVFDHTLAVFQAHQPALDLGSRLLGVANLNWFARRGL